MTSAKEYVLDWRTQYSILEPYFDGRGGVVHVHAGERAPIGVFVRALRSRWLTDARWRYRWSSVLLDPDYAETHDLTGIVSEVYTKVVGRLPKRTPGPSVNVTVGTGNDVGGNLSITGNEILLEPDHYAASVQVGERVEEICAMLRKQLKKRRMAFVILNSHRYPSNELVRISRRIWDDGLATLVEFGLLLIDISDPSSSRRSDAWPPRANTVVKLPDEFGREEEAHALDDLTAVALQEGICETEPEARMFAKTLYVGGPSLVRDVYSRLGYAMTGLGVHR